MKNRTVVYTVMLIGALALTVTGCGKAAAQEKQNLGPGDFAGTIELTGNAGSLLSLLLPETVYRGMERPDLGDIRVFDAAGNPAPFLIRTVPGRVEQFPDREVPILTWNETTRRFNAPGVEINASGVAVTIMGGGGEEKNSPYLVDLSGLEIAPSKLILDFEKNIFFNAFLTIRSSEDLAQWRNYEKIQTAAYYNSPGTDRNEFDIPRGRYLLLNFEGTIPAVHSGTVRFEPAEIPILGETKFTGTKSEDGKKVRYHTGGCFPVAKIKFILSGPDSIKVTIRESKEPFPNEGNAGVYAGESVIYRIETPGKDPSLNGALDMAGFSGPYWEIEALGEQVFTEIPALSVLWETRELVFLARGRGPWVLAYGSKNCEPASFLSVWDEEVFPAAMGKAMYTERKEHIDSSSRRNQIILWGVLFLSAAVLSVLAVYIVKFARNGEQTTKNE